LVTLWFRTTIAILRIVASFCKDEITYCRMDHLRLAAHVCESCLGAGPSFLEPLILKWSRG
jgi:hypothetical protein